ncbi:metal-dependent hydrolase [Natronosporangium hydrolyticum]|uniref:Metal-dependent hydrolase n=1 Tax=Natronosporangium hydrolyticum TaxID=2811111 RepID=A0A895YJJ5_9ACTN|nr:metal-dependent hydrolase [Natronosporangium hydrolyticum]QSB14290.1 metal-dependent hydrolase [Natronosporangium hydrolyticum]
MGPTHATSGAVAWLAGAGLVTTVAGYAQAPAELAVYTSVCAGAALLPDLDVKGKVFRRRGGATAARVFGVPSLALANGIEWLSRGIYNLTRSKSDPRRRNGHRTFTHTIAFAAMVGALVSVLVHHFGRPVVLAVLFFTLALAIRGVMAEWARTKGWLVTTGISGAVTLIAFAGLPAAGYPLLGVAVGLGCLVHLIGDLITHQGVPVLWPFKIRGRRWYMLTTPTAISVKAGGGFERAVLLPGLTLAACAAATWQVPEIQEMAGSVAESLTGDPAEADS